MPNNYYETELTGYGLVYVKMNTNSMLVVTKNNKDNPKLQYHIATVSGVLQNTNGMKTITKYDFDTNFNEIMYQLILKKNTE